MRLGLVLLLLLLLTAVGRPADRIDFRTHVYPLLHDRCFRCHQGEDAASGIRLDLKDEIRKRVTPGKSGDSLLFRLVTGADPKRVMPAKGERLTNKQVQILRDWIDQGLAWDDE